VSRTKVHRLVVIIIIIIIFLSAGTLYSLQVGSIIKRFNRSVCRFFLVRHRRFYLFFDRQKKWIFSITCRRHCVRYLARRITRAIPLTGGRYRCTIIPATPVSTPVTLVWIAQLHKSPYSSLKTRHPLRSFMELVDLDGFCGSPFWVSWVPVTYNTYLITLFIFAFSHRHGVSSRFLFSGLEYVVEYYWSRCHALFREDSPGLVTLPIPVAVLSARNLLPSAQQVQGHTMELAQFVQTGEFLYIFISCFYCFVVCTYCDLTSMCTVMWS